jgi:hypothetical protein
MPQPGGFAAFGGISAHLAGIVVISRHNPWSIPALQAVVVCRVVGE